MIVRNEDRFVWYAISSVLPFIDKLLIFDTGSTDRTVAIIKQFNDKKIIFREKGEVETKGMTQLREEQIKATNTDWLWIIDGDEIYPQKTARKIIQIVTQDKSLYGIIVHRYDLLGDVYHCQDESVGAYSQFGRKGHYVLRLINKRTVGDLKILGDYPNEYFADTKGQLIKSYGKDKFVFVEERIFHGMYLPRSSEEKNFYKILNRKKPKIELGRKVPREKLPEVFFQKRPSIVPDVTKKMNFQYKLLALLLTPLKRLKRNIYSINI